MNIYVVVLTGISAYADSLIASFNQAAQTSGLDIALQLINSNNGHQIYAGTLHDMSPCPQLGDCLKSNFPDDNDTFYRVFVSADGRSLYQDLNDYQFSN
ncbi:hypothetical protein AB4Y89_06270 [Terriglobus sp. 2YAB30_2]|uniref:hypothetical protein n=1 Tax=Terriglobus sp. 2YAB30_2 TaxID=3233023 RepID=UPI003F9595D5